MAPSALAASPGTEGQLHYRYITVTVPLHCRYSAVTLAANPGTEGQLRYRYITVTVPLP